MNLSLAKSETFGNVQCDFWKDANDDIWMTREQIGKSLEYADPSKQIAKIHERYKNRMDKYSGTVKLTTPGGYQDTIVYSAKGVYEICRWSRQPKANDFYDMVYDILEGLRKGDMVLAQPSSDRDKLMIQRQRAEAMLLNARTRQAKLILEMHKNKSLSPVAVELLQINALEKIVDKTVDHRPEVEKTFSASEIAKELGTTANKIGRIANEHGLKTDEFGISVLDKSKYSDKQVPSFRYNQKGVEKLKELFGQIKQ